METRSFQRSREDLRPIEIIRRYTIHAPGSVLISYGNTKVLVTATVEERVPRHIQVEKEDGHGWITAEYSMLPGATNTRSHRERQKVSGRTMEIQRLIGRSLRASIDMAKMGARTITIDADVIQADGGTRVASITGGYIALIDALASLKRDGLLGELPLLSPVAAVSVGVIDGSVYLDLDYEEDFKAVVDANVVMNGQGDLIEFQATSEGIPFTRHQLNEMVDTAEAGIRQLVRFQEEALAEALEAFA